MAAKADALPGQLNRLTYYGGSGGVCDVCVKIKGENRDIHLFPYRIKCRKGTLHEYVRREGIMQIL